MGQGRATVSASEGCVVVAAVQHLYKISGTWCAAFKDKVAEGQGDMIEGRLSLNYPAAVLIVWIVVREQWRGYSVNGVSEDMAATGLSEVSTEPPALSGRARLKSQEEAVSGRYDGVAQLLSSTHTGKAGGCRAYTVKCQNTRVLRVKVKVGEVQENTVMFFHLNDPSTVSVAPIRTGVIWRMNLSTGSLENATTTSRDCSP